MHGTAAISGRRFPTRTATSPRRAPAARNDAHADPETLRVEVSTLDRMVSLAGAAAGARRALADMLERRTSLTVDEILEAHRGAERLHLDLQDLIRKARAVPLGSMFERQRLAIRELAATARKQARLVVEGEDVEVDAAVVEHLGDPLAHLVCNAFHHGIEQPEERVARGKDPCGTISLTASHDRGQVVVVVSDDGRGLDRERILRAGVEKGLLPEGERLADEEILGVLLQPGFSARVQIGEASSCSGGMDVVRRNVEALRGSASVASKRGRGTTVTLRVPVALGVVQGYRVSVSDVVYVVPLESVAECLELPPDAGRRRAGVLDLRGRPLPFVRLRDQLGLGGERPERENVVVVRHAGAIVGLGVDALLGASHTLMKPLDSAFQGVRALAGSAVLDDGSIALVLDVPALAREALARVAFSSALASA